MGLLHEGHVFLSTSWALIHSRLKYLHERQIFRTKVVKKIQTHFAFKTIFRKPYGFRDNSREESSRVWIVALCVYFRTCFFIIYLKISHAYSSISQVVTVHKIPQQKCCMHLALRCMSGPFWTSLILISPRLQTGTYDPAVDSAHTCTSTEYINVLYQQPMSNVSHLNEKSKCQVLKYLHVKHRIRRELISLLHINFTVLCTLFPVCCKMQYNQSDVWPSRSQYFMLLVSCPW
jgi:hypothetical protein